MTGKTSRINFAWFGHAKSGVKKRLLIRLFPWFFSGLLFGAGAYRAAAEQSAPRWRFEAGPVYRANMRAVISGASRTQDGVAPAAGVFVRGTALAPGRAPAVGDNPEDIGEYGNRFYDDGFVLLDEFTFDDGWTVNFCYLEQEQYDAEEGFLTFRRTTRFGSSVLAGKGFEKRQTVRDTIDRELETEGVFDGWGLRADVFYGLFRRGRTELSLAVGVRGFRGMQRNFSGSTFSQTVETRRIPYRDIYRYEDRIVDTYRHDTLGQDIPEAPYCMADGDVLEDPYIANLPSDTRRESTRRGVVERLFSAPRTNTRRAENRVVVDVDADLYQICLGTEMQIEPFAFLALSLRPSLIMNALDVTASRREQFVGIADNGVESVLNAWHDKNSASRLLAGAGIELASHIRVTESVFLGLRGGYEWVDKTSITVGPNKVALDLSGYTASAAAGVKF